MSQLPTAGQRQPLSYGNCRVRAVSSHRHQTENSGKSEKSEKAEKSTNPKIQKTLKIRKTRKTGKSLKRPLKGVLKSFERYLRKIALLDQCETSERSEQYYFRCFLFFCFRWFPLVH
jgi:hypothetical protein